MSLGYLKFYSDDILSIAISTDEPEWDGIVEYQLTDSPDPDNWIEWDGSEISGNVICMRGLHNTKLYNSDNLDVRNTWIFESTTTFSCDGDIYDLRDFSHSTKMSDICYAYFFADTMIKKSPSLSETSLSPGCYFLMFAGCEELISAPDLPALYLPSGCYAQMFVGCSKLITPPMISGTELEQGATTGFAGAGGQCVAMFAGCTNLKQGPKLYFNHTANDCCASMFEGCLSLEFAYLPPASNLHDSCYDSMFCCCEALKEIFPYVLPAINFSYYSCFQMFSECSSLVIAPTFRTDTKIQLAERSCFAMFWGCTSLQVPPNFPMFDELPSYCFANMFASCTSLVAAPDIYAYHFGPKCCERMFADCDSLHAPSNIFGGIFDDDSCACMFAGCFDISSITQVNPNTFTSPDALINFLATTNTAYALPFSLLPIALSDANSDISEFAFRNFFSNNSDINYSDMGIYTLSNPLTIPYRRVISPSEINITHNQEYLYFDTAVVPDVSKDTPNILTISVTEEFDNVPETAQLVISVRDRSIYCDQILINLDNTEEVIPTLLYDITNGWDLFNITLLKSFELAIPLAFFQATQEGMNFSATYSYNHTESLDWLQIVNSNKHLVIEEASEHGNVKDLKKLVDHLSPLTLKSNPDASFKFDSWNIEGNYFGEIDTKTSVIYPYSDMIISANYIKATLSDYIQSLQNDKENLISILREKGLDVDDSTTFTDIIIACSSLKSFIPNISISPISLRTVNLDIIYPELGE